MSSPAPLIKKLIDELNYPVLNLSNIDDFLLTHEYSVLFFTEDANRIAESNDVAVILPELVKSFPLLNPAIIARSDEEKLKSLYGFLSWPALVFMRRNTYLDTITRVQDWGYYMEKIKQIISSAEKKSSMINIPIKSI